MGSGKYLKLFQVELHETITSALPTTGGLASGGLTFKRENPAEFSRPNAKPLGRYMQAGGDSAADNKVKNRTLKQHGKE
jgi:hypothetical protein